MISGRVFKVRVMIVVFVDMECESERHKRDSLETVTTTCLIKYIYIYIIYIIDYPFAGCTGITTLTLPDSITSIGDDAFWGEYKGGIGCGQE